MKFLIAITAFLLVLSYNLKSVAEDAPTAEDAAVTCSKEDASQNCTEAGHNAAAHGEANHNEAGHGTTSEDHSGKKPGYGANYDWSHKRQEQVSAIFPPKKRTDGANVAPAKVKLISPKFLSKISGETVKLEWTASEGANFYHVQVSRDAGFNNRSMYVTEDKNVTTNSFEVKGLEAGVKYFWRVAAVSTGQESMYTKSAFVFSEFEVK